MTYAPALTHEHYLICDEHA